MIDKKKIKAIAFDFGGTLDSPFLHWMDIYLKLYTTELHLPLTRENFRDAYVDTEQKMERMPLIKPTDSLLATQMFKTVLQFNHLIQSGVLSDTEENRKSLPIRAALLATDYSSAFVKAARPVLEELQKSYTLLLVSNYYGNVAQVAADLGIASYFQTITDSTIAGVRKPDPALWKLAIDGAGFQPEEVLVVGDSMKNDILPGISLGCQVVQGCPEVKEEPADITIITKLEELLDLLDVSIHSA